MEFENMRTDLATEARDMYVEKQNDKNETVRGLIEENKELFGYRINKISLDDTAAEAIGKKQGNYITVYMDELGNVEGEQADKQAFIIMEEIKSLLEKHNIQSGAKGLVIGLGNNHITPDALGPATIDRIVVTNHLFSIDDPTIQKGYRPLAAMSPGVMGVTGLETSEIVQSVSTSFQPDFIIVIDALASRSIERVNKTIQITDTGIHPGSGVGNHRKEISEDTVHVPVIAIGIPTVVDAVSIVSDTFDYIERYFSKEWEEKERLKQKLVPESMQGKHESLDARHTLNDEKKKAFLGLVGTLSEEEKRKLLLDILSPTGKNLIVTPKEVDQFIENTAEIIANAINAACHFELEINI